MAKLNCPGCSAAIDTENGSAEFTQADGTKEPTPAAPAISPAPAAENPPAPAKKSAFTVMDLAE